MRRTYFRTGSLRVKSVWHHFRSKLSSYSSRKKNAEKIRAYAEHTSVRAVSYRASSGHVTHVTSGQKAPLGRILRNFRLCMHIAYFRTGLRSRDFRSRDWRHFRSGPVTSLPVTWLPVMCNGPIPPNTTLSVPIYSWHTTPSKHQILRGGN
jgi:hypothetical protein